MLFNSYEFIFLFLPITLIAFFKIGSLGYYKVAIAWLVLASLFFYGWWNPSYLGLIIASILFNYAVGSALSDRRKIPLIGRKGLLILGLAANLGLLGYYKYANFFIESVNQVVGTSLYLDKIVLPLGISFFTFQQVAYVVESYRQDSQKHSFLNYSLFVTFFPQLIAGPIVHHEEVLPQFAQKSIYRSKAEDKAVGLTIFCMGLFKKVIFADNIAIYATPIFHAAAQGTSVTFVEAWGAALAYTLQLYFDFSGYSDMAIGASRMFGIKLPTNFNSPYKAVDIIDFWRRWHITLSRFLRDYIYIPLGGNRKGEFRRYVNLIITMLLGGLWHGAGWTFIIWGGLHGVYLVINHKWHGFKKKFGYNLKKSPWWSLLLGRAITFLAVVVAWVLFRAENLQAASAMFSAMLGANGVVLNSDWQTILQPVLPFLNDLGVQFSSKAIFGKGAVLQLLVLMLIVWSTPNVQEWMSQYEPALNYEKETRLSAHWKKVLWQPNQLWAIATTCMFVVSILMLSRVSEFLYFDF